MSCQAFYSAVERPTVKPPLEGLSLLPIAGALYIKIGTLLHNTRYCLAGRVNRAPQWGGQGKSCLNATTIQEVAYAAPANRTEGFVIYWAILNPGNDKGAYVIFLWAFAYDRELTTKSYNRMQRSENPPQVLFACL